MAMGMYGIVRNYWCRPNQVQWYRPRDERKILGRLCVCGPPLSTSERRMQAACRSASNCAVRPLGSRHSMALQPMRASRAPVVRSRRAQPCCSLRQLVPAAVGAAFIGAVVAATLQSSKQQQDDLQARRQRRQHEGGPLQQLGNLLPTRPGFGLGWPLRSEEKRLLKTVRRDIVAGRQTCFVRCCCSKQRTLFAGINMLRLFPSCSNSYMKSRSSSSARHPKTLSGGTHDLPCEPSPWPSCARLRSELRQRAAPRCADRGDCSFSELAQQ